MLLPAGRTVRALGVLYHISSAQNGERGSEHCLTYCLHAGALLVWQHPAVS